MDAFFGYHPYWRGYYGYPGWRGYGWGWRRPYWGGYWRRPYYGPYAQNTMKDQQSKQTKIVV